MQDHSHKLLFLGASALMCSAAMFGAQAGPGLPVDNNSFPAVTDAGLLSDTGARPAVLRVVNVETRGGTATIVPNGTSCPAANAAKLVAPSGTPSAAAPRSQPPLQSDAVLGTGSSCPPVRADARTDVSQGISPATPKPLAANSLPARPRQP